MSLANEAQTAAEHPSRRMPNGYPINAVRDDTAPTAVSFQQLQLENQQLRDQLEDLADAWEGVRAEVGNECAARERLRAALQAAQAEAETERRNRLAAEQRAEAAEAELEKCKAAAATLTERCERALRERAELRTGTAELKARLEAAFRDLDECRAEIASLSQRLQAKPPPPLLLPPPAPAPTTEHANDDDNESRRLLNKAREVSQSSTIVSELATNRPCKPVSRDRRIEGTPPRRSNATVSSISSNSALADDAILQGGSALVVRLHRLERENSALRHHLGIPDDSSLPADVYYGRRSTSQHPEQQARRSQQTRRLNVEQWTARHERLKRLLDKRFSST